jgi:hypothetical protein
LEITRKPKIYPNDDFCIENFYMPSPMNHVGIETIEKLMRYDLMANTALFLTTELPRTNNILDWN